MDNKGLPRLREELDQFKMETFEIEDLATPDQGASVTPIVCSTSDCVYCCSCISVPPISIVN